MGARASHWQYALEVPDRQALRYVVDFRVEHPGVLGVHAEWSGSRILSFRLEGPVALVHPVRARRSGPSPQRMEIEVDQETVRSGDRTWRLFIRALPARGEARGVLTLAVPDPPGATPAVEEIAPPPAPPEPRPWLKPAALPSGAPDRWGRVFEAVEGFRAWVTEDDANPRLDSCGWQVEVLRYLARARGRLAEGKQVFTTSTGRFLERVVKAVNLVEELRSSEDPIVAGPAPEDYSRRRAWLAVRRQRILPIEAELDQLSHVLRGGFAPELADETWPPRFIGCLMACQRHFEQRPRLGEERAANGVLARGQWSGFLLAARALSSLLSIQAATIP